jgi:hypothetical protein
LAIVINATLLVIALISRSEIQNRCNFKETLAHPAVSSNSPGAPKQRSTRSAVTMHLKMLVKTHFPVKIV